jgi:hypothetical protein
MPSVLTKDSDAARRLLLSRLEKLNLTLGVFHADDQADATRVGKR